jgi:hypothetical protein
MPYFCTFTQATSIHPFTSPTFLAQLALNPYPFLFNECYRFAIFGLHRGAKWEKLQMFVSTLEAPKFGNF